MGNGERIVVDIDKGEQQAPTSLKKFLEKGLTTTTPHDIIRYKQKGENTS